MGIRVFELERVQSLYENTVDYNLTESGFHPLTLRELLTRQQLDELEKTVLGYGQTNGSMLLRERIAELYPEQTPDNVLVTNGSAEANFVACHSLLEAGDEVLMMVPNYMQIWGIAEEMGAVPKAFHLREENGWAPDLDELEWRIVRRYHDSDEAARRFQAELGEDGPGALVVDGNTEKRGLFIFSGSCTM